MSDSDMTGPASGSQPAGVAATAPDAEAVESEQAAAEIVAHIGDMPEKAPPVPASPEGGGPAVSGSEAASEEEFRRRVEAAGTLEEMATALLDFASGRDRVSIEGLSVSVHYYLEKIRAGRAFGMPPWIHAKMDAITGASAAGETPTIAPDYAMEPLPDASAPVPAPPPVPGPVSDIPASPPDPQPAATPVPAEPPVSTPVSEPVPAEPLPPAQPVPAPPAMVIEETRKTIERSRTVFEQAAHEAKTLEDLAQAVIDASELDATGTARFTVYFPDTPSRLRVSAEDLAVLVLEGKAGSIPDTVIQDATERIENSKEKGESAL